MTKLFTPFLFAALLSAACQPALAQTSKPAAEQKTRDLAKTDVCQLVPGEAVARALGMKLVEAQSFVDPKARFSRCTYFVVPVVGAGDLRKAFSIWLHAPEDFEELRQYTEGKMSPVPGLADGAYAFQDPGDGRSKLRVLKKDDAMIEATADSAEAAQCIAEAAIASLWPAK